MAEGRRTLVVLSGTYAVCRLDRDASVPGWAARGRFSSVTRTAAELSVVCPEPDVPEGVRKEGGWSLLMLRGPLDFSLTGVVASMTVPLAREGIGIFVLSTFDTDYLLVKSALLHRAIEAWKAEGHSVAEGGGKPQARYET